ncbi:MAG TPA: N-acetyltransferase [Firmicutes bacterium]|nr:N-acetyltransferase [Bacillota bacterium]
MLIRKACLKDVDYIYSLIKHYAAQELMLPRNIGSIYQNLRDFSVIEDQGHILGVGALHILWHDLAEIRSLAIDPDNLQNGLGFQLVNHLLEEAAEIGFKKVFTLTYQPGFFEKCGFKKVRKEELPQKVWLECVYCIKFPNCDEIALIKEL